MRRPCALRTRCRRRDERRVRDDATGNTPDRHLTILQAEARAPASWARALAEAGVDPSHRPSPDPMKRIALLPLTCIAAAALAQTVQSTDSNFGTPTMSPSPS